MGGNYSYLPSVPASNNFFCVTFRVPDGIKVIDCDPPTLEVIRKAVARSYRLGLRTEYDKYGARSFVLAGNPFKVGCSKEEAIAGKQVACAILQDLQRKGWRTLISSELCRTKDLSTWFFERQGSDYDCQADIESTVCCLALSGFDKFQLINFPKRLLSHVTAAVRRTWTLGIQEQMKDAYGSIEMKMNGNPWSASERGAVEARRMILELIRVMAAEGFALCMSTSIKDTTDSLFFRSIEDAKLGDLARPEASFALSLNRQDRLRLIEAPAEVQEVVRGVLLQYWTAGVTKDRDYHGSHEFKLAGSPWWTEGAEAVRTRLLVTVLIQELRDRGWRLLQTVALCRRLNDKSVFLFARDQPENSLHWCLSLHDKSILRFVNAPVEVVDALRLVIAGHYIHGIKTEKIFAGYHQVRLRGRPWSSYNGNDHVHGRHMMLGILEAMQQRGWGVVASADVSAIYHHADSGQDFPVDAHSWWFAALKQQSAPATE